MLKKLFPFIYLLAIFLTFSTPSFATQDCSASKVSCSIDSIGNDSCWSSCGNTQWYCDTSSDPIAQTGICEFDSKIPATSVTPYMTLSPASPTPPPPPCVTNASGICASVYTGLGQVPTNITGFISTLFSILLSISGAIAITVIIFSGYRIMISQGNPEQIKGAREALTSAIIGLLFMIFSVAILQIIGVNILHIPGFSVGVIGGGGGGGGGSTVR